jgi:FtsZ-binding cell division protein ZapB
MDGQKTKLEKNELLELIKKLQNELEEEKEKNKKLTFELRTLKTNQVSLVRTNTFIVKFSSFMMKTIFFMF